MTPALVLFAAFIVVGVPIAFALGAAALVGLWLYEGAPLRIVASRMFGGIDNFSLLAIPFVPVFFIAMQGVSARFAKTEASVASTSSTSAPASAD